MKKFCENFFFSIFFHFFSFFFRPGSVYVRIVSDQSQHRCVVGRVPRLRLLHSPPHLDAGLAPGRRIDLHGAVAQRDRIQSSRRLIDLERGNCHRSAAAFVAAGCCGATLLLLFHAVTWIWGERRVCAAAHPVRSVKFNRLRNEKICVRMDYCGTVQLPSNGNTVDLLFYWSLPLLVTHCSLPLLVTDSHHEEFQFSRHKYTRVTLHNDFSSPMLNNRVKTVLFWNIFWKNHFWQIEDTGHGGWAKNEKSSWNFFLNTKKNEKIEDTGHDRLAKNEKSSWNLFLNTKKNKKRIIEDTRHGEWAKNEKSWKNLFLNTKKKMRKENWRH